MQNQILGETRTNKKLLKIKFEDVEISSTLFGSYNYSNIMCAIAVGKHFGVNNQQIKQAIENYNPTNARSQVIEKKGCQIILDSYKIGRAHV
mgnify:CR=1 FL=1